MRVSCNRQTVSHQTTSGCRAKGLPRSEREEMQEARCFSLETFYSSSNPSNAIVHIYTQAIFVSVNRVGPNRGRGKRGGGEGREIKTHNESARGDTPRVLLLHTLRCRLHNFAGGAGFEASSGVSRVLAAGVGPSVRHRLEHWVKTRGHEQGPPPATDAAVRLGSEASAARLR